MQKGGGEMAIDLWAALLERPLTELETTTLLRLLPSTRRDRLLHLQQEEKRREPLCAYLMLRLALWEQLGWKELPLIETNSMGKPFFPHHPEVHFNLSHSNGAVLVGISDQPIGVDIEKLRPVSQRTAQRLAGGCTEQEFFQSWVRREARCKRNGNGVSTMMRSETPLQYGEFYYELDTFPGYVAGVATREHTAPGEVRKYSLDHML
jgi:4'-phosphopantetheinyl transferase